MGAKVFALMRGDTQPRHADIRELMHPVFCHRVLVNFLGTADDASVEGLLNQVIESVPAPDFEPPSSKKKGFFSTLLAKVKS
jgi:MoxR-like ATPase